MNAAGEIQSSSPGIAAWVSVLAVCTSFVSEVRAEEFGYECPAGCRQGFVWRTAKKSDKKSDLVCVLPDARKLARAENALAAERRVQSPQPSPDWNRPTPYWNTPISLKIDCKPPFTWRQAFPEDYVCVSENAKNRVREENKYSRPACSTTFCQQWTMFPIGHLKLTQSNGFTIYVSFVQDSFVNSEGNQPHAHGSAYYESGGRRVTGFLRGNLYRNKFSVTVQWENATRGYYAADVTENYSVNQYRQVELVGELTNGWTSDDQHPTRPRASWVTEGLLSCHRYGP